MCRTKSRLLENTFLQRSLACLQLELVVADREVPIEEKHAFDASLPVCAQRLPLPLFPAGNDKKKKD